MYVKVDALLDNTIFEARMKNNEVFFYKISPAPGYKLHEITLDEPVFDEETGMPTEEIKPGYTTAYVTTEASYDFITNDREIYAVKE